MPVTPRLCLLRPTLLMLTFIAATDAFAADALTITIDHAKVMHISRPADIVIIGNPGIADATIQDQQTLIITGRSYGSTNLIVLDSNGKAIAEETLSVEPSNDNIVSLYKTVDKRITRQSFSCTPDCSPTLTIGDDKDVFSAASSQIKDHNDFSKGPGQ